MNQFQFQQQNSQQGEGLRLILFIVLSIGIMFIWSYFFAPKPPKKPKLAKKSAATKPATAPAGKAAGTHPTTAPATAAIKPQSTTKPATARAGATQKSEIKEAKLPEAPKKIVEIKTDLFWTKLTTQGGGLNFLALKNFWENPKKKKNHLKLFAPSMADKPTFTESLRLENLPPHRHLPYQKIERLGENRFRLESEISLKSGKIVVQKEYLFEKSSYKFKIKYKIINRTKDKLNPTVVLQLNDYQDPKTLSEGGMFSLPKTVNLLCRVDQEPKPERIDFQKLIKELSDPSPTAFQKKKILGNIVYAGIDRRYFIMGLIPLWGKGDHSRECQIAANRIGEMKVSIKNAGVRLDPGASYSWEAIGYWGPKYYHLLKEVGYRFENTIDFGFFAFLSKPLLWTLKFFHSMLGKLSIPNWGLAIILLTFLVKLLLWPLTHHSMESMKKMQKLKPKMDELKEKYGDDKEAFNREMMNLYIKEGINPLSSCIPMLLQMPIWIALYNTLFFAVELYQAPFIPGWIDDLSSKDPYFILPIALGVSMLIQQKLTPQTMDNAQTKFLTWFMPIFFTAIMLFLPAGLTLYIFVNTVISILHQWHLYNTPDKPDDKKPKKVTWMEKMQKILEENQQKNK